MYVGEMKDKATLVELNNSLNHFSLFSGLSRSGWIARIGHAVGDGSGPLVPRFIQVLFLRVSHKWQKYWRVKKENIATSVPKRLLWPNFYFQFWNNYKWHFQMGRRRFWLFKLTDAVEEFWYLKYDYFELFYR